MFPDRHKNPEKFERWIKACKLDGTKSKKVPLICSLHFDHTQFSVAPDAKRKTLNKNTNPNIFPTNTAHSDGTTSGNYTPPIKLARNTVSSCNE